MDLLAHVAEAGSAHPACPSAARSAVSLLVPPYEHVTADHAELMLDTLVPTRRTPSRRAHPAAARRVRAREFYPHPDMPCQQFGVIIRRARDRDFRPRATESTQDDGRR